MDVNGLARLRFARMINRLHDICTEEIAVRLVENCFAATTQPLALGNQFQEGGFGRHDRHERISPFKPSQ